MRLAAGGTPVAVNRSTKLKKNLCTSKYDQSSGSVNCRNYTSSQIKILTHDFNGTSFMHSAYEPADVGTLPVDKFRYILHVS
jgi:hypothetical protein